MSRRSVPIDLSILSRRDLLKSAQDVRKRAGCSPGPDGRTKEEVLGKHRRAQEERETLRKLGRWKRGYRFGSQRVVEISGNTGPKKRKVTAPNIEDRIVLNALACRLRRRLPTTRVVCEGDPRASVAMVALWCSRAESPWLFRTDLAEAFDSIEVERVIRNVGAEVLGSDAEVLRHVYRHFGPGAPAGLATSSLMLDLACMEFDRELEEVGWCAFRYVDDVVVVGESPSVGDKVLRLVEKRLWPFGLKTNPSKTRLHSAEQFNGHITSAPFPADWIGHKIGPGQIDISDKTTQRLLCPH